MKQYILLAILLYVCQTSLTQEIGYAAYATDFGDPLESGFYGQANLTSAEGDVPDSAHPWSHLITVRHQNSSNNYQLQIAASYADNDRLFFRKIAASGASNPSWLEFSTRGSNTFSGNQVINGQFSMHRIGSPAFPNGLITDSQSLHSWVDDGSVWFVSEQDENAGAAGSFNFVLDDDGSSVPSFNIYPKSSFSVPALRVLSDGRVGVGTTSPDHKLDVKGTIRAEEVIVETDWADYVFEDGYELLPLDQVSSRIENHGHLPGVPSAAEVSENGLSLGDSQSLLMAKIEELTLYTIEQDRELVRLRHLDEEVAILKEENARLSQLEDRLATLESMLQTSATD